ncbi:unnamed protein product [Ixodes pacificus]
MLSQWKGSCTFVYLLSGTPSGAAGKRDSLRRGRKRPCMTDLIACTFSAQIEDHNKTRQCHIRSCGALILFIVLVYCIHFFFGRSYQKLIQRMCRSVAGTLCQLFLCLFVCLFRLREKRERERGKKPLNRRFGNESLFRGSYTSGRACVKLQFEFRRRVKKSVTEL